MNKQNTKFHYIILCLFILPFIPLAKAADGSIRHLIEYSLSVSNQHTDIDFQSGDTYKTNTSRLGINWYESFSPYFHAGLEFGYIDMTQIENSLSSAQFTSGQYAGLLFRFLPVENSYLTLIFNLNYRYNSTQGKNAVQESQFIWSESTLGSELHFRPSSNIGLFIAADYQLLDGNQRNTGNINQVALFKGAKSQGFRLGSSLKINHNGEIKLQWFNGFKEGVEINFTRTF